MSDALYGGWVALATVGLLAAGGCEAWLVHAQKPKKAREAMAAASEGREALLAKSTSDAGWARLVRVALRADAQSEIAGGYRESRASASPELAAAFAAERARVRRVFAGGVLGAVLMLASAVPMLLAPPFLLLGALIGAVSLLVVWGVVLAARRARSALEDIHGALPALATRLGPPSPPRAIDAWNARIHLRSSGFAATLLLAAAAVGLPVFVLDATRVIHASSARFSMLTNMVLVPLVVRMALAGAGARIELDRERRELVVVRHVLGVPFARTRVPLDVARGASTLAASTSNSTKLLLLDLTAPAAQIPLHRGYGMLVAAEKLNALLR